MKKVIYHVTYKLVGSANPFEYHKVLLKIEEDQENGKASDKYEDFMVELENATDKPRHLIIIINTIKFE